MNIEDLVAGDHIVVVGVPVSCDHQKREILHAIFREMPTDGLILVDDEESSHEGILYRITQWSEIFSIEEWNALPVKQKRTYDTIWCEQCFAKP